MVGSFFVIEKPINLSASIRPIVSTRAIAPCPAKPANNLKSPSLVFSPKMY